MKNKNKFIQISCDGGAATGKSTGGKVISKKYRLKFLSSGLLYRYASFLLLRYKPKNKLKFLKIKFKNLNYKKLNKMNLAVHGLAGDIKQGITYYQDLHNSLNKLKNNTKENYEDLIQQELSEDSTYQEMKRLEEMQPQINDLERLDY